MKKLIWAGFLAVPLLAVSASPVVAHPSGCLNLQGGFRLKLCYAGFLHASCESFPCCASACGPTPCGGGCGGGYGGGSGGSGGCPGNDCSGYAPGPWYTYWPTAQNPYVMSSPVDNPAWTYENNWQTPAPLYPYWAPVAYVPMPSVPNPNSGFQPASYAPSYWYGR
jgi:hypothetical protein